MKNADKQRRILITGGNGQLGRALAETFADADLFLGRHETEDVTNPDIVHTIGAFQPDVVIHAAAMTDVDACEVKPDQAFLVNEQGTRHVTEGARRAGALMVYVSTDYVFDGTKENTYVESDPPNPINVYGQSKLAGERAAQEETNRWVIVRTSWVYGRGRKNFVTNVLEWAKMQPVLKLVKDKLGSPTNAGDLASAIRFLVETDISNHVVHVSGKGECNWVEYGREILSIAGIEKEIQPILFEELRLPAKRPAYTVLRNAELERLGYMMRRWQVALRDFLEPGGRS